MFKMKSKLALPSLFRGLGSGSDDETRSSRTRPKCGPSGFSALPSSPGWIGVPTGDSVFDSLVYTEGSSDIVRGALGWESRAAVRTLFTRFPEIRNAMAMPLSQCSNSPGIPDISPWRISSWRRPGDVGVEPREQRTSRSAEGRSLALSGDTPHPLPAEGPSLRLCRCRTEEAGGELSEAKADSAGRNRPR